MSHGPTVAAANAAAKRSLGCSRFGGRWPTPKDTAVPTTPEQVHSRAFSRTPHPKKRLVKGVEVVSSALYMAATMQ
jgi:hypothetical protein